MMVKKRTILTIVLFLTFLFLIRSVDAEMSHPHWTPEEVAVGRDVTVFVTISHGGNETLKAARLNITGVHLTMIEIDDDGSGSKLYSADLEFNSNGTKLIIVEADLDGKWVVQGSFVIDVMKGSDEGGERTILGLPSWYCSITVIILTVIVIFLTWAYFRGRAMVKAKESGAENGAGVVCSSCGKPVGMSETYCPWCGVSLDEDEYLCGKCDKAVGRDDKVCENCGANLVSIGDRRTPLTEKPKGPSLEEKMKIDNSNKRECDNCGTVLMNDEKICPVCGN